MQIKKSFLTTSMLLLSTFGGFNLAHSAPIIIQRPALSAPTITSPANNTHVKSPLVIKGTANKNAEIEISVKSTYKNGEQDLGTFKAHGNSEGNWSTTPIILWAPEDAKDIKFKISATQTIHKRKSHHRFITVLPAQKVKTVPRAKISPGIVKQINPKIASRVIGPKINAKRRINITNFTVPLAITSPKDKTVITTPLTVEGTAKKNSRISVIVESNHAKPDNNNSRSVRAKADKNGKWKTGPIKLWLYEDATDARFTIIATEYDTKTRKRRQTRITVVPSLHQNFPKQPIKPRLGLVKPSSPLIAKGTAGSNRTIEMRITSSYKDSKGKRVWLPEIKSSTTSDRKGKWASKPIILPAPETERTLKHFLYVRQIGLGRISSSIGYSFHSDPNKVVPPHMIYPRNDSAQMKNYPIVKGTGVPNRYVEVTVKRLFHTKKGDVPKYRNGNLYKRRIKVDADGNWQTRKINLGGKDPNLGYRFEAVQIFPQYDHKKVNGKYPEVRSKAVAVQLRQARGY